MDKVWSAHAMGCYSVLKRKDILTQASTWMNLEDAILSEISQSQKGHALYDSTDIRFRSQIHRDKVEGWVPGAGGGEGK